MVSSLKYDISVDVHTVATEAKLKKRKRERKKLLVTVFHDSHDRVSQEGEATSLN